MIQHWVSDSRGTGNRFPAMRDKNPVDEDKAVPPGRPRNLNLYTWARRSGAMIRAHVAAGRSINSAMEVRMFTNSN